MRVIVVQTDSGQVVFTQAVYVRDATGSLSIHVNGDEVAFFPSGRWGYVAAREVQDPKPVRHDEIAKAELAQLDQDLFGAS